MTTPADRVAEHNRGDHRDRPSRLCSLCPHGERIGDGLPPDYHEHGRVEGGALVEGYGHEHAGGADREHHHPRRLEAVEDPAQRPVSVFLQDRGLAGGHHRVGVFIGRNPGARGLAGELVLREEEWAELGEGLRLLVASIETAAEDMARATSTIPLGSGASRRAIEDLVQAKNRLKVASIFLAETFSLGG